MNSTNEADKRSGKSYVDSDLHMRQGCEAVLMCIIFVFFKKKVFLSQIHPSTTNSKHECLSWDLNKEPLTRAANVLNHNINR